MHLVNIIIFLLYHTIVKHTKIIRRADKNWAYFLENKAFWNLKMSKKTKFSDFSLKNDYENQKFAIFEELFDNFGRSHNYMI